MTGVMRGYLMTRGFPQRREYSFLGEAPPERWWSAAEPWIYLDAAELLVSRHGPETTGLLLSGIPSRRRDASGAPIRYTVVLDQAHEHPAPAATLIRCGLDDAARTRFGLILDEVFDAPFVERQLAQPAGWDAVAAAADVVDRLGAALRRAAGTGEGAGAGEEDGAAVGVGQGAGQGAGTPEEPVATGDRRGSWVGAVRDAEALDRFRARAHRLLLPGAPPGLACTTHALGSAAGARRLADALPDEVAVLLHDTELEAIESLDGRPLLGSAPAVASGKSVAPGKPVAPGESGTSGKQPAPTFRGAPDHPAASVTAPVITRVVLILLVLLAVLVILVGWLLTG